MKKSPDTFRGFRNLENDLSGSKTMQIIKTNEIYILHFICLFPTAVCQRNLRKSVSELITASGNNFTHLSKFVFFN